MNVNAQELEWLERDVWCFQGLPLDRVTLQQSVEYCFNHFASDRLRFVSTSNVNFMISALEDPEFLESVIDSDFAFADGAPIVWLSRLLGINFPERVAGSTLFETLLTDDRPWTSFFFGGKDNTAELACKNINASVSSCDCKGFLNPGIGSVESMSTPAVINELNEATADFLVVSLGAKKGQSWISKNRKNLKCSIVSHLGAVVNFTAGSIQRAPMRWQALGLEWLWRIKSEPALKKRYLKDGFGLARLVLSNILPLSIYQVYLGRKIKVRDSKISTTMQGNRVIIEVTGYLDWSTRDSLRAAFIQSLSGGRSIVILCESITYIDSAVLGSFVQMKRIMHQRDLTLSFQAMPRRIHRLMELHNIKGFLTR